MEKFHNYIAKWINGEKVRGISISMVDIRECIRIHNAIVHGEKPDFINGNVKSILDKCGIDTKACGIGWQVA